VERVEVVRGPASVLYGSDAIGGVIQLITGHDFDKINSNRSFNISLNSASSRVSSGFSLVQKSGKFLINTGFQYSKVDNYRSPERVIHNSGYTNLSGVINLTYSDGKRSASIRYIGGSGKNIGKPDRENNPDSFSIVNENSNHIFLLKFKQKELFKDSDLKIDLFLNPTTYILEKGSVEKDSSELSETRAVNSGFGIKLIRKFSGNFSLTSGLDLYQRNNLDITNTLESGIETPLGNGTRRDLGIFISANVAKIIGLNFRGGIRYTFAESKAVSDGILKTRKKNSPSLFLALVKNFSRDISFFFNTGTSFRNPSLSETYYTGITGRRYVIGNPLLDPEKSLNIDTGIKIHKGNLFLGVYCFYNTIDDMIERYRSDDGTYTYDNIESGRISGGETEFQWFPSGNLELFGHFNYYKGISDETEDPLNDIPSPKLFLGWKINLEKLWFEMNYLHSFSKSDPGPSEIWNNKYDLITLKGGYYFSSKLFSYLKVSNLLNDKYFANPDPDIPESNGIALSAGLNFFF
ncbi:MAG: TonB-dependent receptor, partial [Candidatus Aminicenantes bacterium]|nr:TonB-dependent receptor [Candidatus Aminicenantes bacterium]